MIACLQRPPVRSGKRPAAVLDQLWADPEVIAAHSRANITGASPVAVTRGA